MGKSLGKKIGSFLSSDKYLPLIAGVASGLYPLAFYYTNNFDFVNSWSHFIYFTTLFLVVPTVVFYLVYFILHKKYPVVLKRYVLPALNVFVFVAFLMLALYAAIRWKHALLIIFATIVVLVLSKFFRKTFSKILILQYILFLTTIVTAIGILINYINYSDAWMEQPDAIEQTVFQKTPNVYVIQADGYMNFSELGQGYYNFDNSQFESWLQDRHFKLYEDFRSNYYSTLSSNASLFAMKHHYYDLFNEREIIMNRNKVLSIFKNNNYTTHFLAEVPYLLMNRPGVAYDRTNFDLDEIPFISEGLDINKNIIGDLPSHFPKNTEEKHFYFIEKLLPGHITTFPNKNTTIESERDKYISNLQHANDWLQIIIGEIETNDPEAIIIIMADHGGFVGFDYSLQSQEKTTERDLLYSVFSTALAIKWPEGQDPGLEEELRTSVNLFRVLFSYLSEDETLLEHLQENTSYVEILKKAPKGSYKVLDKNGKPVFEKQSR